MSPLRRDENRVPIGSETFLPAVEKVVTFAGGTANDPGDHDGTGDPTTLYTVTGVVRVRLFGLCIVDLVGASATIEVGVTGNTALIIPLTTAANIIAGEIWHDTTPDSKAEPYIVVDEYMVAADIKQEVKTANITAGQIKYYCQWTPVSWNGNLVATA